MASKLETLLKQIENETTSLKIPPTLISNFKKQQTSYLQEEEEKQVESPEPAN